MADRTTCQSERTDVAAVDLQTIDAPLSECLGIQVKIICASRIASTSSWACVCINTQLEAAVVHLEVNKVIYNHFRNQFL